jgi:polyisoprenoid-binding protein YceI
MQQTAVSSNVKTYNIDEAHSTVRFWVKHMMISKVHGELHDVTGTVQYDAANPAQSEVDVKIKVESLTTKQDQRDAHLKSEDFLAAEQFPLITFKSTSFKATGDGEFDVTGDLTIRDQTRSVTFKAEASPEIKNPMGEGYKVGVSARGEINREDFNVTWNMALETGGFVVGKDIHFEIDLELDRPA